MPSPCPPPVRKLRYCRSLSGTGGGKVSFYPKGGCRPPWESPVSKTSGTDSKTQVSERQAGATRMPLKSRSVLCGGIFLSCPVTDKIPERPLRRDFLVLSLRVILAYARLTRPRTAWEFEKLPFRCAKPRFLRLKSRSVLCGGIFPSSEVTRPRGRCCRRGGSGRCW